MTKNIGNITNTLAGLLLLTFGIVYLIRDSVMPYHEVAMGEPFSELSPNVQLVVTAFINGIGGSFITIAAIMFWLQYQFNKKPQIWIANLIFLTGGLTLLFILQAVITLRLYTEGNPPLILPLVGLFLIIGGYIFNQKSIH